MTAIFISFFLRHPLFQFSIKQFLEKDRDHDFAFIIDAAFV